MRATAGSQRPATAQQAEGGSRETEERAHHVRFPPPAVPLTPSGPGRALVVPAGTDLLYVAAAAVLAVVLSHIPVLDVVVYPFKLFGTFVHEWSHAIVTVVTGGHVVGLRINPDLSGEEYSTGGWGLAISSAGYLGTACTGAALLLAPLRRARHTLVALGVAVAALPFVGTLVQGATFTPTTWLWTAVFAAVTLAVGRRGTLRLARLFQQFLAVEVCLAALDGLRSLDWLVLTAPGVMTDATTAGSATHLPALVWAVLWSIIGVAIVGLATLHRVQRALRVEVGLSGRMRSGA
jgi:hypothetical protein